MKTVYKIQYRDPISLTWMDVQKRLLTKEDAVAVGRTRHPDCDLRIVEITGTKRIFTDIHRVNS